MTCNKGSTLCIIKKDWNNWHDFFYKLAETATADYKPADLSNLFNQDDENDKAAGDTFMDKMQKYKDDKTLLSEIIKGSAALKKVVYKHTTEWKVDDDYVTAFCGNSARNIERIKAQQKALAFTAAGVNDNNWYFHPISFIDHLNKVMSSNPYIKGFTYKGVDYAVTSNPGFAPVSSTPTDYKTGGNSYTKINGIFNENYAHLDYYKDDYTRYSHEGVDLYGELGTNIHSLIHAEVLAYGWFRTFGRTIILRNLTETTGIYLLAHLSDYADNIYQGMEVKPGQVVGKVGGSGRRNGIDVDGHFGTHLHITYYHYENADIPVGTFGVEYGANGAVIKQMSIYSELQNYIRDPFNHNNGIKLKGNVEK